MRKGRTARAAAAMMLLAAYAWAQTPATDPLAVLQRYGQLTVWVVGPPVDATVLAEAGVPRPTEFREQTNASFGQTSGSFGKSLSDIGVSSDSPTLTAPQSLPGANAPTAPSPTTGYHEVTTAELGQKVGNFAKVTAANARAAKSAADPAKDAYDWTKLRWAVSFSDRAKAAIPRLELVMVRVPENDLQRRLETVEPKAYPDLVLGDPLPAVWSRPGTGLAQRYGLAALGETRWFAQGEGETPGGYTQELAVLRQAPRLALAKAFLWWVHDNGALTRPWTRPQSDPPVAVAVRALNDLLQAQPMGEDADAAMASYDPREAQVLALGYPQPLNDLNLRIGIVQASFNERFAVVALQAVVESTGAAGGVHAVVVLRPDPAGRWRVLQITPNLRSGQMQGAYSILAGYARKVEPDKVAVVKAISPASPADGDGRPAQPDLWWDNDSDARLEVVEWQDHATAGTHLFYVLDTGARVKTRVVASFATQAGQYRWRMWSVGTGGALALSPWRTMTITPR